jgi:integrase
VTITKVKTPAGERWEVRGRVGGRGSRQIRKRFLRRDDAQRWATEKSREKQLGGVVTASRTTLDEYAATWWDNYAANALAPKTRAIYAGLWKLYVAPALGTVHLGNLTTPVVSRFQRELQTRGVGGPTILKALTLVQSICRHAVIDGLIPSNPVQPLRKPSQRPTRKGVRVSPQQVEAIRQHVPTTRDAVLISLLAYAGLRPGEALALTWGDIGDNTINVDKSLSLGEERDTKTGNHRTVRLLAPLAEELSAMRPRVVHLVRDEDDGLTRQDINARIFTLADGRDWTDTAWRNWRRRVFKPAAKAAGLDGIRPYDLRGSFCSLLLAAGVNLAEIADEAGNSVEVLSSNYLGVIKELRGKPQMNAEDAIRAARASRVRHEEGAAAAQ